MLLMYVARCHLSIPPVPLISYTTFPKLRLTEFLYQCCISACLLLQLVDVIWTFELLHLFFVLRVCVCVHVCLCVFNGLNFTSSLIIRMHAIINARSNSDFFCLFLNFLGCYQHERALCCDSVEKVLTNCRWRKKDKLNMYERVSRWRFNWIIMAVSFAFFGYGDVANYLWNKNKC